MTKAEIKKAIENGETLYQAFNNHVWGVSFLTYKGKANKEIHIIGDIIQVIIYGKNESVKNFRIDRLFKTKGEAEHHAKWGNRTKEVRFPTPPTYEEFLKMKLWSVLAGEIQIVSYTHYIAVYKNWEDKVFYKKLTTENYDLALEELYKRWEEIL